MAAAGSLYSSSGSSYVQLGGQKTGTVAGLGTAAVNAGGLFADRYGGNQPGTADPRIFQLQPVAQCPGNRTAALFSVGYTAAAGIVFLQTRQRSVDKIVSARHIVADIAGISVELLRSSTAGIRKCDSGDPGDFFGDRRSDAAAVRIGSAGFKNSGQTLDKANSCRSNDVGSDCTLLLGSNEPISVQEAIKSRVFSHIPEKKFAFCAI